MKPSTWSTSSRLAGLRRFAVAITAFNVLGHTLFGFEQSWLQPLVALATGYAVELLLETAGSLAGGKRPRYLGGGVVGFVDFLLSAHISSLAIAMLLYSNQRLWVLSFAVAVALGSKALLRVPMGKGTRHVLNPSNFGITVTLLLFPWVGIAPPYHFTENLGHAGDWLLPAFIVVSGSFLNARYTKRVPLLLAWAGIFFAQAALRSVFLGAPLVAALLPMTGVAFVLFTFYMVTDPATTPSSLRGQVLFGGGVGGVYGLLMAGHIVFGFFFALTIVCLVRGAVLYRQHLLAVAAERMAAEQPAAALPGAPAMREG